MQLLQHFMQGNWAYTEFGVFGVLKPVPRGCWVDWIHMLYRGLDVNAYTYLISQSKVPCYTLLHDFTCGVSFYLCQIERTRAHQRNYSIQIQFGEFWGFTYRGMGEGLLRGMWVIHAAALQKSLTPAWVTTHKTLHYWDALGNLHILIPWKNWLFTTNCVLSI